ncbi:flagellin N-terminal helical domain-containing protein [Halomonas sp. LS-001]
MPMINTNLTSLTTQQSLRQNQSSLSTSMERLSSGLRVNSAKDDAAGQAIGNRFQAQRIGLNQGARNANDGISLSQTAHDVLNGMNEKLQRIRELAVQGLNGTNQTRDSDSIQAEINQNLMEIDRLAATSEYNGIPLMTGQAGNVPLQVGANDGQQIGVDLNPPGFSVEALGLEGLNIAGIDGDVTERDALRGVARDIRLDDPSTIGPTFAPGTQQPLYYSDAFGYYTSDGSDGFSHVSVNASHNTSTDTSQVSITNPQPIFSSAMMTDPEPLPDLPSNQRFIEKDNTYYLEERLPDGTLSYRETGFALSYEEAMGTGAFEPSSTVAAGTYANVSDGFTFNGESYSQASAEDIAFLSSTGSTLNPASLTQNADGNLYIQTEVSGQDRFFALDDVTANDRLVFTQEASAIEVNSGDTFTEVTGDFTYGVNSYSTSGVELEFTDPTGTLVQDQNDDFFVRTGSSTSDYDFFVLTGVTSERDLVLEAGPQGFAGADFSSQPTLIDPEVPAVDFSSLDASNITFNPKNNNLDGLTDLTVVQRESDGQWIIRGQQPDGSQAYLEADFELKVDANGEATEAVITATQEVADVLGTASHEQEKVSGYSEITIDPRNVTVEYTDAQGQTFEDVLQQNEDGNYYFSLPGESSLRGGYKTATLVDLEGTSEILLRTENGGSEVVVYYPSNVSMGTNFSTVALTDADGFNDDGVPHTRLQIRENGEDFRLRVPRNPLAALDRAIGMVDAKRSHLGAVENRLESAISNNETTAINLASAESRIMDADYAQETAKMLRSQIIQQAGNSMLAQANVIPESVLALLG